MFHSKREDSDDLSVAKGSLIYLQYSALYLKYKKKKGPVKKAMSNPMNLSKVVPLRLKQNKE